MDNILYFLILISAILFFQGFFPVTRPNLNIINDPPNKIQDIFFDKENLYTTNITRTIFIIIDALRLDFVNVDYMPLTSKLISKNGCFNKIKVEIPTVTLPRIKALTAGNVPQFIDLVLNLANTEVLSDSIIHSAFKKDKKIVFYGDDTWLKLFPNKFFRYEGTNSFFVRDFTEVDNNVTRNVKVELQNKDWDMMILHYLGLDHIGHVYGPFSPLIPTKLKEMDEIIDLLYTTIYLNNKNTLLIVTGDHGMRDSGGHGGSTYSETNVPLLIMGRNCKNDSFLQTDIPVNLAVLLGLDIPSLSIGRVQKNMIQFTRENYLYSLYYNALILNQKHSCCKQLFFEANTNYINYLQSLSVSAGDKAIKLYENLLETISNNLAKGSVNQNVNFLLIAFTTMINCLIMLFLRLVNPYQTKSVLFIYGMVIFVAVQYVIKESMLVSLMCALLSLLFLNNAYSLILSLKLSHFPSILHFFIFCFLIHPVTFFSSSYVEEEHQFWYFLNIVFLFIQSINFFKVKKFRDVFICVAFLTIFRFLRTMNSTGDKWSSYPDLSDWFLRNENSLWYQILFIAGLILVFLTQYFFIGFKIVSGILNVLILILIFMFKQQETNVLLGRLIWMCIFINYILSYKYSKISTWILVLSLLLKPYNIILIPYCVVSGLYFFKYYKRTELVVLYCSLLGNMLYFAQGHSNNLASVDISVGYIGLSSYQPVLVTVQILCHTQAFPVLCHLLIFYNKETEKSKIWKILFCNKLYIFFITSGITFIFRHHLFIWSVFAPKLFIEFVNILFLFIEYFIYNVNNIFSAKCMLLKDQWFKKKINFI